MPLVTRRTVLVHALTAFPAMGALSRGQATPRADAHSRLEQLERTSGGRLGVAALALSTGRRIDYRADERFAMCSTFKVLAVALVLSRVDRGEESLSRRVHFDTSVVVPNSPWTTLEAQQAGSDGMPLDELCAAALIVSDNTAANLLLESCGGPVALTAYARTLGDEVTRLDRRETALNDAVPGDPRDTTSPAAMVSNLRTLALERALSPASRERLVGWMVANERAPGRLRAGVPRGWRVANKPGTGGHGATNDIAVLWPPDGMPMIVSAYYAGSSQSDAERDAVVASVGQIVSSELSRG